MKIFFVIPKNKNLFGDEALNSEKMGATPGHPHVGIAYLTAFLKKHNVKVLVYDEMLSGNVDELYQQINEFKPDLIGITMFSYCYQYAYDTIVQLKAKCKYPIVIGGPHVSAAPQQTLRDTRIDFAIKGEGEETLLRLLEEMQKVDPHYDRIDGLIWWNKGEIIENKDRTWITNLDFLPFPDFETFTLDSYSCSITKVLPIITSRGCPYGCNYCSVKLSMGRNFRARSPENVVDEMEYWYKKGWRGFDINDDCFSFDIERAMRICDLILKRGLKIVYQLYNGIRPDRITLPLLEKMKKSGCIFLSYGCEAGNDQVLKNIKKGFNLEQVRQAVRWTKEAGIKNSVNFIIGHPGETPEIALDSLRFARSLPTNFVNFYNLLPYPGTDLFKWIDRNGRWLVDRDHYLEKISYRDNLPVFETDNFSAEARKMVLKKGFALYEWTILRFRLGKILGGIVYFLTRGQSLAKFGRNFALGNKCGIKIYRFLSVYSRK